MKSEKQYMNDYYERQDFPAKIIWEDKEFTLSLTNYPEDSTITLLPVSNDVVVVKGKITEHGYQGNRSLIVKGKASSMTLTVHYDYGGGVDCILEY